MDIDVQQSFLQNMADYKDSQDILGDVLGELSNNSYIEYVSGGVCGKRLLLGIIPYPLYSRSQREEFRREVVGHIMEYYDFDEIDISFDSDIIYTLSKYNGKIEEQEFNSLVDSVRKRR